MYELNKEDVLEDFERFLRVEKGFNKKTMSEHKYMAKKYLEYCQEIIPDKERAKDLKEEMMNEDYYSSHINNTMKALEYYTTFLGKKLEIKKLKRPKKLPDVLKEEEVKKMVEHAKNRRDRAIILTSLSTGLWSSELCNLDLKDIDLEKRRAKVVQGKGSKDGVVVFSEECKEAIKKYLKIRSETGQRRYSSARETRN